MDRLAPRRLGLERDPLAAGASWSSVSDTREPDAIITAGDAFARERIAAPSAPPKQATPPAPAAAVAQMPAAASAIIDPAPRTTVPRPRIAVAPLVDDRQARVSPSIELARADVAAGRYDAALTKASAPDRVGPSGAWHLVRGDALRALKRTAEAAGAYESAAHALAGSAQIEAAYSAAYLRYHDLGDGNGALAMIAGTDDVGSPLEERALVLHAEILAASNRPTEAAVIAARYLDRFPRGGNVRRMRALVPKTATPR